MLERARRAPLLRTHASRTARAAWCWCVRSLGACGRLVRAPLGADRHQAQSTGSWCRASSGAASCGRPCGACLLAVVCIEEILASSSILVVHDGSTDIPAGVGAIAMMNLGMKVYLEASFPLPPDLSMIDSCFTIVPMQKHADLILSLESSDSGEKLRVESLDPLLRDLSC